MSATRLNAYLARSGVASRRGADKLIASGSVRVNGRVPPPDGLMVDPEHDRVTVDGRTVKPATEYRYVMLNKPLASSPPLRTRPAAPMSSTCWATGRRATACFLWGASTWIPPGCC